MKRQMSCRPAEGRGRLTLSIPPRKLAPCRAGRSSTYLQAPGPTELMRASMGFRRSCGLGVAIVACLANMSVRSEETMPYVRVSTRNPSYFELSDGRPFIPIGLNLIAPSGPEAQGMERMESWMKDLASHGGNFIRVWISSPFWDIEHERSGSYDEAKAQRIDRLLEIARRHGIRVKLTLEHFREMSAEPRQKWANKPLHLLANGGPAASMPDFFSGEASRERFKQKLAWLARRYDDNPTVFGWELWNEIDAVRAKPEDYMPWTAAMLAELHAHFPSNLAMQSLGSYDDARKRARYREHSLMSGNDVAQVHRYLDLGAPWEICHGPVDVLVADAVRDLRSFEPGRPVILAESGAVEPKHSGPSRLYAKDPQGMLLHDVLFAPFFAGAAGAGQIWHWDVYVDRNRLWHHFGRFAEAVRNVDSIAERFMAREVSHPRLRIYALEGTATTLLWCRDPRNTWQTELEQGIAPDVMEGLTLDLAGMKAKGGATAQVYDPWSGKWTEVLVTRGALVLPPFARSVVVRVKTAE
jgi:hypothetical protein